ncbi:uncharacterized protein TRUGW13939_10304 [Talaromyces rugulosus]|uniref:Transcription factor domain-containing protein n=1 Tax=Talaromyces rugulosus TaxID=121627 RepID=A0A7H8RCB4_TALRU|nr:uncharacterized protein TRUGW13939_10304 [Talaromyces rugulosus]QKX63135.1 hypothetical protein TRUGW13939_10304 [Talaromyces rugulosus]
MPWLRRETALDGQRGAAKGTSAAVQAACRSHQGHKGPEKGTAERVVARVHRADGVVPLGAVLSRPSEALPAPLHVTANATSLFGNVDSISSASLANAHLADTEVSWGDLLSDGDGFLQKNNAPLTLSASEEEAEDVVFMHFFDHVFYLQYPYYQTRDGRERGWLFSILKRVKPAYYATLAQSERHFLATVPHNQHIAAVLTLRRAGTTYYDLAMHGMQSIMAAALDRASLVQSLEALTALLQLLFFRALVPTVANARSRSGTSTPERMDRSYAGDPCISPDLGRACCVVLGSFISFDIIAAASTRGEKFLAVDHIRELATLGSSVQSLMGCRNSVMARRGVRIEERLRQEMENTSGPPLPVPWEPLDLPLPHKHPVVSRLYALAAIIYLHVVLLGAHPYLPEIRQAVLAVLETLTNLQDAQLLQSLSWSFCVAGCLATEDQYATFRQQFSATEAWEVTNGTCSEAYRIMKACWAKRKTSGEECDWASIMDQDACQVLLR